MNEKMTFYSARRSVNVTNDALFHLPSFLLSFLSFHFLTKIYALFSSMETNTIELKL